MLEISKVGIGLVLNAHLLEGLESSSDGIVIWTELLTLQLIMFFFLDFVNARSNRIIIYMTQLMYEIKTW